MAGLLAGHCHIKGHLFKLGQVNSPKCDRCNQATETASYALCVHGLYSHYHSGASVDGHIMQWSEEKHLYQQDTVLCSRCGAARCMNVRIAQRMRYGWSAWVTNVPSIFVFYSFPFCSYYDFYVYIHLSLTVFIIIDTKKLWSVSWLQICILTFWSVSQWNV